MKSMASNGKDRKMSNLRKTHPMVLIAAMALTLFSLLGSAAISGLLPSLPGKDAGALGEKTGAVDQRPDQTNPDTRNEAEANPVACLNCGTVVAIMALEGEISSATGHKEYRMAPAYQIKVRMHNGTYQTLVQHKRPEYLIGDVIRLERRQATV
jgi:hypothetical protein